MKPRHLRPALPGHRAARRSMRGLPRRRSAALLLVLVLMAGCSGPPEGGSAASVVQLTDANFDREVLQSSQPVLVEFWAPWCAPCIEMEPEVEQVAREFSGRVKVGKLRVDEHDETAARFDAKAPPVVISFRDGRVLKRRSGRQSKQSLVELAAAALAEGER